MRIPIDLYIYGLFCFILAIVDQVALRWLALSLRLRPFNARLWPFTTTQTHKRTMKSQVHVRVYTHMYIFEIMLSSHKRSSTRVNVVTDVEVIFAAQLRKYGRMACTAVHCIFRRARRCWDPALAMAMATAYKGDGRRPVTAQAPI